MIFENNKVYDILKPLAPNEDWLELMIMLSRGDERRKIFRKLFRTEMYDKLQTALENTAKERRDAVKNLEKSIVQELNNGNYTGSSDNALALLELKDKKFEGTIDQAIPYLEQLVVEQENAFNELENVIKIETTANESLKDELAFIKKAESFAKNVSAENRRKYCLKGVEIVLDDVIAGVVANIILWCLILIKEI